MGCKGTNKSIVVLVVCLAAMVLIQPVMAGEKDSYKGEGQNLITSVPRTMSYQGILKDSGGNPVTDSTYSVTFRIFNVESSGTSLWDETLPCTTSAGYFLAMFSNVNIPFDEDYWLELEVGGEILDPRQKMHMVAYAAVSDTADYAWNTAGGGANGWVDDGTVVRLETETDSVGIGTTSPTEKLHIEGDIFASGTAVFGSGHAIFGVNNNVTGATQYTDGNSNTISGGLNNYIEGNYSTIGGGNANEAYYNGSTIGGGESNLANGYYALIAGGYNNNVADSGAVCGGSNNTAGGINAFIGGGSSNTASNIGSVIGGGTNNLAGGDYSAVLGGNNNTTYNPNHYSFIGGGLSNSIGDGAYTTIGGGYSNYIEGIGAVIAGGRGNDASYSYPVIGGGYNNTAHGDYSAILGGYGNTITSTGDYSYLFGVSSTLTQNHTFMVDMAHIRFGNEDEGYEFPNFDGSSGQVLSTNGAGQLNWTDPAGTASGWVDEGTVVRLENISDKVGIGTESPSEQLEVAGNILVRENATIGTANTNDGSNSLLAGANNWVGSSYSSILGGRYNEVQGNYSSIAGGNSNSCSDQYAFIGGGLSNGIADGDYSVITGGYRNYIEALTATIGGGKDNAGYGDYAVVGGGYYNENKGDYSVIVGGFADSISNTAHYSYLFGINSNLTQDSTFMVDIPHIRFGDETTGYEFPVSDGLVGQILRTDGSGQLSWNDEQGGNWSVDSSVVYTDGFWGIARGGADNALLGDYSNTMVNLGVACTTGASGYSYNYNTVSGGYGNIADGDGSTVSGGRENNASGARSTVGGGEGNIASGSESTVAGGEDNIAGGKGNTIGGGIQNNTREWFNTICGGYQNINQGDYSTILGGSQNTIRDLAEYSMAFGDGVYLDIASERQIALYDGIVSGRLGVNRDDQDGGINHPIHVGTNSFNGNGARLTAGGTWTNASSREFKENFNVLGSIDLKDKIYALEITSWNYKDSDEKHIGPVAEDFVAAFDVGTIRKSDGQRDNQYLAASDVAGVALAGVKELIQENRELRVLITELEKRITELEDR